MPTAHLISIELRSFEFTQAPIDVVIPCVKKDLETLELCIAGIRANCAQIRRVIVVSKTRLTDSAEWVDEKIFPFTKDEVAFEIFRNEEQAEKYRSNPKNRLGWIFQQLLKLYAPFVIENISTNVLILDADTIFLRPVTFLQLNGAGCFNPGTEHHAPYFDHMHRLLPGLHRVHPQLSGISHHMLFQLCLLNDLKTAIEEYHGSLLWKALLHCIDHRELFGSCLSEYEIYFNYALLRSNQCSIRKLKWANSSMAFFNNYLQRQKLDHSATSYDYLSVHSYMR